MKKILILITIIYLQMIPLIGCDMFMLQSIEGYPFFTLPSDNGDFNDPYDYFEDFKRLSDGSSGNRDGYGIIAYSLSSDLVSRDYTWYKTGIGNHFDVNNPDEPLYQAISLLYNNPTIERVLVHARSGTGGTGSHPFLFNYDDRTYSFMHNGYVFNNVKREIMNFLGQDWFDQHPSQWQGVYGDTYSFIDSELIFHYLMYYILQYPDNIPRAFRYAFNNKQLGVIDMEYILKYNNSSIVNFVLSDGQNTYAYRSSNIINDIYNLSYQVYPDNFIAVKTGSNLANTITKNQMLQLSSQGQVNELSLEPILRTDFIDLSVENIDNDEFKIQWQISANQDINKFKIHRGINQNFANSQLIASVLKDDSNQVNFNYTDYYAYYPQHYYWLEIVFSDDFSEITSNIPSTGIEIEPNTPEENSSIILYPNPFQESLTISLESDEIVPVKIFNLKGQLVDQITYLPNNSNTLIWKPDQTLDQKISNGIYILKFMSEERTITKKVMRIK